MIIANSVIMIFRSAKGYQEFLAGVIGLGGYTRLEKKDRFYHVVEIKDVVLYMFVDLNSWTRLEKFIHAFPCVDWIVCKDFHPDELEINLFRSRIKKGGALSAHELFIDGPEDVSKKLRWWQ